jgi:hypothetical protein
MLSRALYYRSYPLYTYNKWWYTDKYKQKLRKYTPSSLTEIDMLVQVVLSELQVDEIGNYTDYEESNMITITDDLSDFIVDLYNTYYKTSLFHLGKRYLKMETTCHRGIFHVTGQVPTGLVDIILEKACNVSTEPVEHKGTIYVVYGFEVHNI